MEGWIHKYTHKYLFIYAHDERKIKRERERQREQKIQTGREIVIRSQYPINIEKYL